MSEIADRYQRVAGGFTERVNAVSGPAWELPAPCDGWVARDVVRHLVEWIPDSSPPQVGLPYRSARRSTTIRSRPGQR